MNKNNIIKGYNIFIIHESLLKFEKFEYKIPSIENIISKCDK